MTHLFLGSIGVLAETSELQRQAFNDAFAEVGLDWNWSREAYSKMLRRSGGQQRIADYAEAQGMTVDAVELHRLKSTLFQARLDAGVPLRPGVIEAIAETRKAGGRLAFVSGTLADNVDAILAAARLSRRDFDLVTDATWDARPKPAPDLYLSALETLGIAAEDVLAVEDNPDGLRAASAAGIRVLAFPGLYHDGSDFTGACAVQTELDPGAAASAGAR
ncbi:HAD-IA family hydrolase [Roseibacterium sp. SDUM158017]|uniref:HAD-IA family hydrolase n=1 Tax=Roseicyclus salinarum TaxID=3036773 RepID=UPI0024157056|nr:HAD-IA family hydrolase [Roseibacterium sp. SDUM158017]MDG4649663.1 HAD-IA family hydrolase [Roseibacterium sp. SDUM158017]